MTSGQILLTGASGFVGQGLSAALPAHGFALRVAGREEGAPRQPGQFAPIGNIAEVTEDDWRRLLEGCTAVVHAAGLAHAGNRWPEETYMAVNARPAARLAAAAARAGVRIVYLSSIRAQSGPTAADIVRESDVPLPTDAYGRSKLAAERAIAESGADFVTFRPVLVVGEGAKGNLATMTRWADGPWPLPFARLEARRSLIARDDLIDAILLALAGPAVPTGIYIAADPRALTIAEMIAAIRDGLGRPTRNVPVPSPVLSLPFRALGKGQAWSRLSGALVADPVRLMDTGWRPNVGAVEALRRMARHHRSAGTPE
jgi:UDP-glucose 4-epimerase